jgi:hypothetical protein
MYPNFRTASKDKKILDKKVKIPSPDCQHYKNKMKRLFYTLIMFHIVYYLLHAVIAVSKNITFVSVFV